MPRIRFIRGAVFKLLDRAPGDELEVTEREAHLVCEGYKDAVRVEGEAPAAIGMTVRDQIQTRDPVAEHRDPAVRPASRKK